jgi:hypothetical protein
MSMDGMPAKSWKAVKSLPLPMVLILLSHRSWTVWPGMVWFGDGTTAVAAWITLSSRGAAAVVNSVPRTAASVFYRG